MEEAEELRGIQSALPCLTLQGCKKPLKLQLPSLLWLPDGGGVCVPLDPLSLDSSPALVKPADPDELTFTLFLAIYLSEELSVPSITVNIFIYPSFFTSLSTSRSKRVYKCKISI